MLTIFFSISINLNNYHNIIEVIHFFFFFAENSQLTASSKRHKFNWLVLTNKIFFFVLVMGSDFSQIDSLLIPGDGFDGLYVYMRWMNLVFTFFFFFFLLYIHCYIIRRSIVPCWRQWTKHNFSLLLVYYWMNGNIRKDFRNSHVIASGDRNEAQSVWNLKWVAALPNYTYIGQGHEFVFMWRWCVCPSLCVSLCVWLTEFYGVNLLRCEVNAVNKHQCTVKACSSIAVNPLEASEIGFWLLKGKQFPLIKSARPQMTDAVYLAKKKRWNLKLYK